MTIKSVEIPTRLGGWEERLLEAVRALRYGSVEVVVHDGRVVQIETRERVRFADSRPPDHRRRPEESNPRTDRKSGGAVIPSHPKETDE
jgi:hypothetical protein